MTTPNDEKQAILDTVKLFETLYERTIDHLSEFYGKENCIPSKNHVLNYCYLCEYSYTKYGNHVIEMCQLCPCVKYLGDKCFNLNFGIQADYLASFTIKWGLKYAYKMASHAKVDCDFKYWIKVRNSGGKIVLNTVSKSLSRTYSSWIWSLRYHDKMIAKGYKVDYHVKDDAEPKLFIVSVIRKK